MLKTHVELTDVPNVRTTGDRGKWKLWTLGYENRGKWKMLQCCQILSILAVETY